ncbi:MAG: YHYH protein, partial [Phycisphaerales bacterium]|nr:YHYH protein [Phycisphaerales bacterium]
MSLLAVGEADRAEDLVALAETWFRATPATEATMEQLRAEIAAARGDRDEALRRSDRAFDLCASMGDRVGSGIFGVLQRRAGLLRTLQASPVETLRLLVEKQELRKEDRSTGLLQARLQLAGALLASGAASDAVETYEDAVEDARRLYGEDEWAPVDAARRATVIATLERDRLASGERDEDVRLRIERDEVIVESAGVPGHEVGPFPNPGNPNTMTPRRRVFRFPLAPRIEDVSTPCDGIFGVALNGIVFDPGTAEYWSAQGPTRRPESNWNYDALSGGIDLGIDGSNGHVQPDGTYHYHGVPRALLDRLGDGVASMRLVGFAADGFPLYTSHGHIDPMDASRPVVAMRSGYRLRTSTR